jgi:hypothetical protein
MCLVGDGEEITIVADRDGLLLQDSADESHVDIGKIGDVDSSKMLNTSQKPFNEISMFEDFPLRLCQICEQPSA